MDLMRNDNFFNLMSFISELNEDPSGYVSFQKQCNKNLDKKMIILNNEETKKKLEAMEIFIKIYNSLKKFVNSWDSDQQVKIKISNPKLFGKSNFFFRSNL